MVDSAYFSVISKDNVGLAVNFSVNPSSCENSPFYSNYLKYSALGDLHAGRSTTHLFIDSKANRIMGFVSLRASSIISKGDNNAISGIPAIEVSVLAVDRDYAGRGVGRSLIDYVIYQADQLYKNHIGVQYIVLAADEMAVSFYKHMDFVPIKDRWSRIPKDGWSANCLPMSLFLDFENDHTISYSEEDSE